MVFVFLIKLCKITTSLFITVQKILLAIPSLPFALNSKSPSFNGAECGLPKFGPTCSTISKILNKSDMILFYYSYYYVILKDTKCQEFVLDYNI
jgi:hypothetical protein